MELIELDATAQRALELLTNAGMSDGSIYDYTHTGFGSILRHFHTKGILYATAEMLDNFLLEQRVLLDQGDISQWKWGLVRRSCELLKQCAAMNSIDLPDLQPWDPVWNRPKQIIQHDAPTAKQFAESENIYVLVWMVNKRMEQLGLSENTVRHYTEEGLAVILKKHYDSGTESYSDKLISQLTEERRLQYEQGEVGRTTYQNLRKAAAMLQEFRLTGKITLERIPNWGRREVIPQHKAILDKFSAHVTTQSNWAESSVSTVTSVARVFLLELEDHGIVSIETVAMMDIATCVTRMLGRYTGGMRSALFGIRTFLRFLYEAEITADNFCKTLPEFVCPRKNFREGFSDDELERLLSQPDITSAVGKRDYASLGHEKGYRRQQYLPQPYDAGARVCQILKPQRRSCLHSAARHCQERCAVCPVHLHRGRNPGHLGCFRPLETERWFPGAAICDPSYDKADVLLRSASI